MQITIRKAHSDDAALLAELNRDIQQIHADAVPSFFKVPDPHDPALIANYTERLADEHTVIFIAEADGIAVASMVLIQRQNEENPYAFANSRLTIDQLAVNEGYRGQGIGQALMHEAKALSRELGADYLALNVWVFNTKAIEFYKREGFESASLYMWQKIQP